MSSIKYSKYVAIFFIGLCLILMGYDEVKYRLLMNPSSSYAQKKEFQEAVFEYTFEVEQSVKGIKTDLGFYNLKKSENHEVDLIKFNEWLKKGDRIKIKIVEKTKDYDYPMISCVKKGNDIIWNVQYSKFSRNVIKKPNHIAYLYLIVLCIVSLFVTKFLENRLKSRKHQIIRIKKREFENLNYSRLYHNLSLSICNNDFIVFQKQDRIRQTEVMSHDRINNNIKINKLLKSYELNISSIDYLVFDFQLVSSKQTYYESELYFQTQTNDLIHLLTSISSYGIRFSKHEKTDFYKDMLAFVIVLAQELGLNIKNTSNIRITNPNNGS